MPENSEEKISVCIITGNEEHNIRRCLESVTWADEIVVIDSFSTDRTVEIVREYTDRVYQHPWMGYIGQKKLIRTLATGPWIMFVDADEEVSEGLRNEIIQRFEEGIPDCVAGFEFPRMVRYLGRWIRHGDWYPDYKLRLFCKKRGNCGGKEPHDRVYVDGQVQRLTHCLYHYTYNSISDQLITLNRFSGISAQIRKDEKYSVGLHDLLLRPPFRFIRGYLFKRGFLDGVPGLVVAACISFGTFIKYAKLWELNHLGDRNP